MAFYHSANCNCPVGCCDCGPTLTKYEKKILSLKHEIEEYIDKIRYTAVFKNVTDKRRRVIKPYTHYDKTHHRLVKVLERPTIKRTIVKIDKTHDHFKRRKNYSVSLLKSAVDMFIRQSHKNNERNKINEHLRLKFEYVFTETRTEWKDQMWIQNLY